MSGNFQGNFASYSSSSSSFTSSGGTQQSGTRNATYSTTDPSGTTTTHTMSQNLGEPAVQEIRRFNSSGRELPTVESNSSAGDRMIGSGASASASASATTGTGNNRVEDVTESEADREYRERMEEEYAKREGGA